MSVGKLAGSFPGLLALLGHLAADEAVAGAEQFGNDQDVVVAEGTGFVPLFALLVGAADGDIEERAAVGFVAPDRRFERAVAARKDRGVGRSLRLLRSLLRPGRGGEW